MSARKTPARASKPPPARSTEYVLGTHAEELARLGLQHRLWSEAAHQIWERAGLRPGLAVLDVGCGPGFATMDMAQIVGTGAGGHVLGVDESAGFVEHVNAQAAARALANVRAVVGDVQDLASNPAVAAGSFDAAYIRWVLCFVSDPEAVVRGIARALKPGGVLAVQDYFNYTCMTTAPRSAPFTKAVEATAASWRDRGGDPDVMGRLPGILEGSGWRIDHLGVHQRLARPGSMMWHWPQSFWKNFLPILVKAGYLTGADQAAWEADWARLGQTPGALVLLPPVFDVVATRL